MPPITREAACRKRNEPVSLLDVAYEQQCQSPFFNLPGEIRDRIYEYTLAEFEDETRRYDELTYFARPDYFACRRCDTAILRTCRRAYAEAWFQPWTNALHTTWLGSPCRAPAKFTTADSIRRSLYNIYATNGDVEVNHVRFFAQLYALQPGRDLSCFLDIKHFHPRTLTITLRHTDWWFWESDEHLMIACEWVNKCKMPASLKELRMELESIDRRKGQIDSVAEQMRSQWYFTRKDGVYMFADNTPTEVTHWQGPSTLDNQRWLRDEKTPGKLDYYIKTVIWRPDASRSIEGQNPPTDIHTKVKPPRITMSQPSIDIDTLQRIGAVGMTADEVLERQRAFFQQPRRP